MKNKKAFTLIELIAVIVVLAIILTITIPIVSNLITSARKASFKSDARMVLDQVRIQKNQDEEFDPTSISYDTLGTYNISNENYESLTISMVNSKPYIYVVGKNKWAGYKACGTYNNMGVYEVTELGTCQGEGPVTFPKVTDSNPGEICLDYSTDSTCYIKSVEDLVGFSKSVESGKDYLNKTVILVNGLDINSTKSYVNSTTTALGDINGDGTPSGLLTEITTGKGFNPIGSDTKQFKGTFEGNAKTIGNLYINRPAQNYVGLFGYNSGIIRGFTITDENITGAGTVGGLVGYNNGAISDVSLQGTITSINSIVGGIAGYNNSTKVINSVLANVIVAAPNFAGGLVGSGTGTLSGVIESGSVTTGPNTNRGRISADAGTDMLGYVSSDVVGSAGFWGGYDGTVFDASLKGNINVYDGPLDTWIGGDNDSSGYYFDYNDEKKLIIKKVVDYPMTFALSGSGTNNDPYLIESYDDWKKATLRPSAGYYYKLTNNIDFADKNFYALGSSQSYFSGELNGEDKTISNITTNAMTNAGIVGYNNGVIRDLNIDTVNMLTNTYGGTITGYNNGIIKGMNLYNIILTGKGDTVGGLVGYNNGTISDITLQGTITSANVGIGGIAGYNNATKVINSVLVNVIVTGTNFAGGLVGSGTGTLSGVIESGSVTTGSYTNRGRIAADAGTDMLGYVSSDVVGSAGFWGGYDGIVFDASLKGNINVYDGPLDTWIGGDNDSSGYYFDYNDEKKLIIKKVVDYPMTFALSGSGTNNDPYLIGSYDDWKKATLRPSAGYYYKLTNNIDFTGKNFYALGSSQSYFSGELNGEDKTISNITTNAMTNAGIFGYNNGVIRDLNVDTVNMLTNTYGGTITGYNNGIIKGMNLYNIILTGKGDTVGGLVGYNDSQIYDISLQGTITSAGSSVGGIAGYNNAAKVINNVLVNVIVKGLNVVGGLVGSGAGTLSGVMESGSVKAATWPATCGEISGEAGSNIFGYVSSGVPAGGGWYGYDGTIFNVSNYNNLTSYNSYGLDTRIDGDNDSSGYYFDYNSDSSNIIVKSWERNPILILTAINSIVIIDEGATGAVSNYFTQSPPNKSGILLNCTNGITDIGGLSFGKNTVTCQMSYTNQYGTYTSNSASVVFEHRYIATSSLACPSGYYSVDGTCYSKTQCAELAGGGLNWNNSPEGYESAFECRKTDDLDIANTFVRNKTIDEWSKTGSNYYDVVASSECLNNGESYNPAKYNFQVRTEYCNAWETRSKITVYNCPRGGNAIEGYCIFN